MEYSDTHPALNENFFGFVKSHLGEDAMRLRLKRFGETDFSIDLAITQIEIRNRHIEKKLPTWAQNDRIVFPSLLSTEQCSSEATAVYKQRLVRGNSLCDLTGGLGIDTFFMAQCVDSATYVERNSLYCHCAKHNYKSLNINHIKVVNSDCNTFLTESGECFDTIFIDPARRGKSQERLFALADCEPNVLAMLPLLLSRCKRLIIKLSPMVDIAMLQHELSMPCSLYVVSLRNECKEILAVIDRDGMQEPATVTCAVIDGNGAKEFCFDTSLEAVTPQRMATEVGNYLYEPDVALLKAGVFRLICERWDVSKLHVNSHLYTSHEVIADFPGRGFRVIEVLPFSSSLCKVFAKRYASCNITTRNFPLSAVELRKRLKVRDGGENYLFATTHGNSNVLIICNKS